MRLPLVIAIMLCACDDQGSTPDGGTPDAWRWAGFEQWGDACFRKGATAPVQCKGEQGGNGWCVRYLADVCMPQCEPDGTCSVGCPNRGELDECFCAPCF